jgi:hypothetical protein
MKKPAIRSPATIALARQRSMVDKGIGAELINYTDEGAPLAHEPDIILFLRQELGVTGVFIEGSPKDDHFWQSVKDRIVELHLFEQFARAEEIKIININVLPNHIFIDFKNEYGNVITSFASRINKNGKLGSGYIGASAAGTEIARSFLEGPLPAIDEGDRRDQNKNRPDREELDNVKLFEQFKKLSDEEQQHLYDQISGHMKAKEQTTPSPHEGASSPPDGQMYAARPNRKESAPQFIERVYGGAGWLTGEFTRAELRKLDSAAVMGLENWERKNGRASLNLPTVKERNDRELATEEGQALARTNPNARLHSAMWRRRRS